MNDAKYSCIDQEHKHTIDDCETYYCSLRKIDWWEWFQYDECLECPYARSYDDEDFDADMTSLDAAIESARTEKCRTFKRGEK